MERNIYMELALFGTADKKSHRTFAGLIFPILPTKLGIKELIEKTISAFC